MKKIKHKILCFFGCHYAQLKFLLEEDENGVLQFPSKPSSVTCQHCGINYLNDK